MKNINNDKNNLKENKVALSFRENENKKVLFRLFNTKREKSVSFKIYENAKLSTTIKDAFLNNYRKVDIEYDTTKNNRFKKVNLLVDINSYIDKSKKNLYLDFLILRERKAFLLKFTKKRNFRKILKTLLITIIVK